MPGSKITITFADDVTTPGVITFQTQKNLSGIWFSKPETFYIGTPPRNAAYKIPMPVAVLVPDGSSSADDYKYYWNADYNGTGIFSVTRIDNVVTIEVVGLDYIDVLTFGNFSSHDVNVTAVIDNIGVTPFTIDSTVYAAAVVPCTHVEVSVTTSVVIPVIYINDIQVENANVANPYVFEILRGVTNNIRFVHPDGFSIKSYLLTYEVLGVGNIAYEVAQSINGATLTINYDYQFITFPSSSTVLEYSLNDINWQSSNIFTGQGNGAGTIYIRDQFGCKISTAYTITDSGTRDPYLFISKANSVGFVESEVIDNCSIHPNENNTFAFNGLENIKYCDTQLYQTCDEITLQFKSNYDTPTVKLRHENGVETAISLLKRTSNLNRFQNMDCTCYKYEENYLGIYFNSGQTYDELDIAIGTYTLNGNLPDFAIKGQFIEVDGLGTFEIIDIVFDSIINKKAIIIQYLYNGAPFASRVKSLYDLLPFEVYEFIIDWSVYGEGIYDILIDNTDTYNGTVQHLSENIWIRDYHEETLAITYYNENNRDIFYKYGIKNFIRVPYLSVVGSSLQESEINITDLKSSITESSVHELDTFNFDAVVKSMMRKLSVALSCENVFINGIGYVKNGAVEIENIENTNLYSLSCEMIKTNINYNNNRQGQEGLDEDTIEFNIPSFITDGTNNLKA